MRTSLLLVSVECGLGLSALIATGAACDRTREEASKGASREPAAAPAFAPRPVRVLLEPEPRSFRLRSVDGLTVHSEEHGELQVEIADDGWLTVNRLEGGAWQFGRQVVDLKDVVIRPGSGGVVWLALRSAKEEALPMCLSGTLRLCANGASVALINNVELEDYVACVTAREIRADFHPEAFLAQTILCRTFALVQMRLRQTCRYDVVATEGSQVYAGRDDGPAGRKAKEAAARTAGLVCTTMRDGREDLFPTYYSAACGGASQPARTFVPGENVEPLRGLVTCDDCRIAPEGVYRWGPVELREAAVREAVARRYPNYPALGVLAKVEVRDRTELGRPLTVALSDVNGREFTILAEHLRLAVGSRVMRSTDCRIALVDGKVRLDFGRGFGHGLGLCQWGMQGQALAGRTAAEILRYYFPGSSLTRVY